MEILLLLVALGVAAYYFFRGNIRRGSEALRAHVFLGKLERGGTLEEAKYLADNAVDISSRFSVSDQHQDAMFLKFRCDTEYGGKTFPMIADAYQKGMKPNLPLWQQKTISSSIQNPREAILSQVKPNTTQDQLKKHDYEVNGHELKRKVATAEKSEPQSFEDYQSLVLNEVKRLDGMSVEDVHWSELYDDDGTKRAFEDGVDPKTLATIIVKKGIPL